MENKYPFIKQRIKQVADIKNVKYKEIYRIMGMTDGGFKGDNIKRPINSDAIVKLYTFFPDIDLHWLLTGEHKKIENNYISDETKSYEKETIEGNILALRKGNELLLKRTVEIIDKLNRSVAKDIIQSEKKRVKNLENKDK